jgi:hypothetical protein
VPSGGGTETKSESYGFSNFHGFWFGQQVYFDLGCLGGRTSP